MAFQEIQRRAQWFLEHKAKPAVEAEGSFWPEVLVFRGQRFINAMALAADGERPLRAEVEEALAVADGDAFILVRTAAHPSHGDALLVYLEHPAGRRLWCTPFVADGGVAFRPTETAEGDGVNGPWAAALWA